MKVSPARKLALDVLNRVTNEDGYANLVFNSLTRDSKLSARDKAFAQELAFGSIRLQNTYDAIIDNVSSRPSNQIDAILKNCLRLGCHQLLQMRVPNHAAISETVELVRSSCGENVVGFANGILRSVSLKSLLDWFDDLELNHSSEQFRSIRYSHPEWVILALKQALSADGLQSELTELLESNNIPALVNLVALPGLASRPDTSAEISLNRFSPYGFSSSFGNPAEIAGVRDGLVRVQDEGSQLAALALAEYAPSKQGENWLDLCAGPGGKAALLAALANQSGVDFQANELQEHRAKLVEDALRPVGRFEVSRLDGREIGKVYPSKFDRILVDAPCTGLGALRRRPEARWRKSNEDLKDLTALQFDLVTSALEALKPGGLLMYVTCSPHLSETTAIVSRANKELGCEVLDLTSFMNSKFMIGSLPKGRKTVQLFTHRDGTDSMFMALLRKPN